MWLSLVRKTNNNRKDSYFYQLINYFCFIIQNELKNQQNKIQKTKKQYITHFKKIKYRRFYFRDNIVAKKFLKIKNAGNTRVSSLRFES